MFFFFFKIEKRFSFWTLTGVDFVQLMLGSHAGKALWMQLPVLLGASSPIL